MKGRGVMHGGGQQAAAAVTSGGWAGTPSAIPTVSARPCQCFEAAGAAAEVHQRGPDLGPAPSLTRLQVALHHVKGVGPHAGVLALAPGYEAAQGVQRPLVLGLLLVRHSACLFQCGVRGGRGMGNRAKREGAQLAQPAWVATHESGWRSARLPILASRTTRHRRDWRRSCGGPQAWA